MNVQICHLQAGYMITGHNIVEWSTVHLFCSGRKVRKNLSLANANSVILNLLNKAHARLLHARPCVF